MSCRRLKSRSVGRLGGAHRAFGVAFERKCGEEDSSVEEASQRHLLPDGGYDLARLS